MLTDEVMISKLEGNGPVEPAASRTIKYKHVVHGDVIYEMIFNELLYGGLLGHGDLQRASVPLEIKYDLRFDASNPKYPHIYVHIACNSDYDSL